MSEAHVVVTTSKNYQQVFDIFLNSIQSSKVVKLHVYNVDLSDYKSFDFQSDGWYAACQIRISNLISFMKENPTIDYVVHSDADIQYFKPDSLVLLIDEARNRQIDYFGMRENDSQYVNGGFFIIRNNKKCLSFLQYVVDELQHCKPYFADQTVINDVLIDNPRFDMKIDIIPANLYIWGDNCATNENVIFHHAVGTNNTQEKINQLQHVRIMYDAKCWEVEKTKKNQILPLSSVAYIIIPIMLPLIFILLVKLFKK